MTLYRKYRPQIFKDLIGQRHIKITLENEIRQDKIAHAYLFTGSRGIGKTTMARLLAKALNCQERKKEEAEPCNKCLVCQEMNHGHFLDLIEIDAASNRGINEIRELRERVRFAPSQGKYKIFIIDESHMLTTEAFNALLKTLEEPPKHVIFILATTEPHKLPETIISRCQRFDFKRINPEEITKRLEKISKAEGVKVEKEVLKNISYHCQGSSRDAEGLLGQVLSLGEKKIGLEQLEIVLPRSDLKLVIELVDHLVKKRTLAALILIKRLVEEGVDLEQFIGDLIEFLRKILIFKISEDGTQNKSEDGILYNLDKETNKKIQEISQDIEMKKLMEMIELFIEKKGQLKWAEIPQLPIELAVVTLSEATGKLGDEKVASSTTIVEKESPTLVDDQGEKEIIKQSYGKQNSHEHEIVSSPQSSVSSQAENLCHDKENVITLEQIQSKWKEVLTKTKECNHSLSAFLKMGKLVSWENDVLLLSFPFKFHQEKIKDIKNKKIIEEILSRILEIKKIQIKPVVETKKEEAGILGKIVSVFGGKVEEGI